MDTLTEAEIKALHEALDDEYMACSTYDQVIQDFGEVAPFSNIRDAERRHITSLLALYKRYGLPVPENTWSGRVDRYPSLLAACQAGVAAEIANGGMYERLLSVIEKPDIRRVLTHLQAASQQRHLPAFQRCVAGGGRYGCGQGMRHRRGHRGQV
ncbi:MAG TPA: DUF2202 domain-containing protein [Spongiibacteraceae bacterium]|jgi:hypothetical protein|nr:DUF2202 domain-containing protein [Spongiibacteraceae bacterium]HUH37118.1 DUF2202 domain-containing protein [Spongiibacteraceae bacterium]